MYAISPAGEELWTFPTGNSVWSAAAIDDAADRLELPPERHTTPARRGGCKQPHVVVAAHPDQVVDRVANARHRERLADARFDNAQHDRVVDDLPRRVHGDVGDELAEKRFGRRVRVGLRGSDEDGAGGEHHGKDHAGRAHQNVCLLRTSSA